MATLRMREMFTPSTTMSFLDPCVMTDGELQRPMWCVGINSPPNISINIHFSNSVNSDSLEEAPQQKASLGLSTRLILPWMTSTARGMRSTFRTAPMTVSMIAAGRRAPVSSAIKLYIYLIIMTALMQKKRQELPQTSTRNQS